MFDDNYYVQFIDENDEAAMTGDDWTRPNDRGKRIAGVIIIAVMALIAILVTVMIYPKTGFAINHGKNRSFIAADDNGDEAASDDGDRIKSDNQIPEELKDLAQRNPEARDFVNNYPRYNGIMPAPLNSEEINGSDGVPLLMQWDKRWGYSDYAGNFFAVSGCGPTCMAMVYAHLTNDTSMSPADMGRLSTELGLATDGDGTKWDFITEGGASLGLCVNELPLLKDHLDSALDQGHPVIMIMGPGDFTEGGHYIVVASREGDKYKVNDPNSRANSERTWDYDTLASQVRNLWEISN